MEIKSTKVLFNFKKKLLLIMVRSFIFLFSIAHFGVTELNKLSEKNHVTKAFDFNLSNIDTITVIEKEDGSSSTVQDITITGTITDASGCVALDTFTVNSTATFTVSGNVNDDFCNSGLGNIDLTISGGILPLSFVWSNGELTEDINGLNGGKNVKISIARSRTNGIETLR